MDITVLRQLSLGLIWVAPDTTLDTQKWPAAAPNVNQYTAPSPLPGGGRFGATLVGLKQAFRLTALVTM